MYLKNPANCKDVPDDRILSFVNYDLTPNYVSNVSQHHEKQVTVTQSISRRFGENWFCFVHA